MYLVADMVIEPDVAEVLVDGRGGVQLRNIQVGIDVGLPTGNAFTTARDRRNGAGAGGGAGNRGDQIDAGALTQAFVSGEEEQLCS